jgi:hypothetical protein
VRLIPATGRQWRDLIVALSAAEEAVAGGRPAGSGPAAALTDRVP